MIINYHLIKLKYHQKILIHFRFHIILQTISKLIYNSSFLIQNILPL